MSRHRAALRVLALGLAFALPGGANAPRDQYEPFTSGATKIRDGSTKLTWQRAPSRATFEDAQEACAKLEARLPTVKELLTLVDEEPHSDYDEGVGGPAVRAIDSQAFPKTPPEPFWTSSTVEGAVRTVHFGTGETGAAPGSGSGTHWYRCVEAK